MWALRDKTLQETITFTDKRKSLLVIQVKEALWRKLNSLKLLFTRNKERLKFPKGANKIPLHQRANPADPIAKKKTENQYACHDLLE